MYIWIIMVLFHFVQQHWSSWAARRFIWLWNCEGLDLEAMHGQMAELTLVSKILRCWTCWIFAHEFWWLKISRLLRWEKNTMHGRELRSMNSCKWKMTILETKLIFQSLVFHFHDYGRKNGQQVLLYKASFTSGNLTGKGTFSYGDGRTYTGCLSSADSSFGRLRVPADSSWLQEEIVLKRTYMTLHLPWDSGFQALIRSTDKNYTLVDQPCIVCVKGDFFEDVKHGTDLSELQTWNLG